MKLIIFASVWFMVLASSVQSQSNFNPDSIQTYLQFLKQNQKSPEDYIASKFNLYDIVMVGEVHQKKEYCRLISKLVESAPINYLATEFIKSVNTERVNRLVTAGEFDRNEAIDILRDYTWPTWGFEDYLAIIQSVWAINSSQKNPQNQIRIIGLDSDWSQYENMCGEKKSPEVLFKQNQEREENMVNAVRAVYKDGTKILVHIGFAHTFYNFKPRFAAELYSDYKPNVFQICLHQPFEGLASQMTINRDIEQIMAANDNTPIGFDVKNSPLAGLTDPRCFYFKVPQHKSLNDIAMGYVFIKPFSQLSQATWIPDFINESNFEKAKCVALKMRFIKVEPQSISEFNQAMAHYFNGK